MPQRLANELEVVLHVDAQQDHRERGVSPGSGRCRATTYLAVVSSRRPIGPRAWSFWVLMPISAPKPNSSPSTKRVEALTSTAAASTSAVNRSAAARSTGDDGLAVARAVAGDVVDGVVERVDHPHRQLEVEELAWPSRRRWPRRRRARAAGRLVADQLDAGQRGGRHGAGTPSATDAVHEQRLGRVAHRRAAGSWR